MRFAVIFSRFFAIFAKIKYNALYASLFKGLNG